MTWQNLLPSSLGNPSYNKTTQEVPLNKRSRKQEPKPYEFSTLSKIRTAPYTGIKKEEQLYYRHL